MMACPDETKRDMTSRYETRLDTTIRDETDETKRDTTIRGETKRDKMRRYETRLDISYLLPRSDNPPWKE